MRSPYRDLEPVLLDNHEMLGGANPALPKPSVPAAGGRLNMCGRVAPTSLRVGSFY